MFWTIRGCIGKYQLEQGAAAYKKEKNEWITKTVGILVGISIHTCTSWWSSHVETKSENWTEKWGDWKEEKIVEEDHLVHFIQIAWNHDRNGIFFYLYLSDSAVVLCCFSVEKKKTVSKGPLLISEDQGKN